MRSGSATKEPQEAVPSDQEESAFPNASVWQSIAVGAMLATALGVAATGAVDLCGSMGPAVLGLSWLVAPVVAISAVVGVAVVSESTWERVGAAMLAIATTGVWLYGLMWASVGEAMQGTTC